MDPPFAANKAVPASLVLSGGNDWITCGFGTHATRYPHKSWTGRVENARNDTRSCKIHDRSLEGECNTKKWRRENIRASVHWENGLFDPILFLENSFILVEPRVINTTVFVFPNLISIVSIWWNTCPKINTNVKHRKQMLLYCLKFPNFLSTFLTYR